MSTLQTDVRCRRSDGGVTVVELLVAVVIVGMLAILVSVPLQMTSRLSKASLERATETMDSNMGLRSIAKQLSSSQITRAGVISCGGLSQILSTTSATATSFTIAVPNDGSELSEEKRRFTIPFSAGSSLGAISPSDPNTIYLTDTIHFAVGDLVTVVGAESSKDIGIFTVTRAGIQDGKVSITVGTPNLNDLVSDCVLDSSKLLTMQQFTHGLSSAAQGSVFVQALQFANYRVEGRKLLMQAFPKSKEFNYLVFDNLAKISITARWFDVAADKDSEETTGSYLARIDVDLMETSLVPAYDDKGNMIRNQIKRSSASYARYVMSSTKKMNEKASTNAKPQKKLFPTCYLAAEKSVFTPEAKSIGMQNRTFAVTLKMAVSDIQNPFAMSVTRESAFAGDVDCVNLSDIAAAQASKSAMAPKIYKNSDFALYGNPSNLASYDVGYCTISGSVGFTGSVSYWDPQLLRTENVKCRETVGVDTKAVVKFRVNPADPPRCFSNGSCFPGTVVGTGTDAKIIQSPTVFKCTWLGSSSTSCCDGAVLSPDPKVTLSSVQFTPPVGGQMIDSAELDVKCGVSP